MVIIYLKCLHTLTLSEKQGEKAEVGHMIYCPKCGKISEIIGKG